MKISKHTTSNGNVFIATISISERELVKSAGFHFDAIKNRWWSRNKAHAAQLADFADDTCKDELSASPAQKMKIVADAITQLHASQKSKKYRIVKLPSGAVIIRGTQSMILEDGTEYSADKVASLYKMTKAFNESDVPGSLLQHGTLIAQCPATDWPLAVVALTAEDSREEVI